MIERVVICVGKNWGERVRKELLRIGIILIFGGLGVVIRYYVWGVLVRSFIGGWVGGRGRLGGSIWRGGMIRE